MSAEHPDIKTAPIVTAECEKTFVDFLYAKLGLVIKKHQLKVLHDAIDKGCRLFGHIRWQDYYEALKHDDAASTEMEQLIADVTIDESYFFRDQNQISWLRDHWLPEIIAQRRQQDDLSLRIWSAGCSNGQELYTIAMLLAEALPDMDEWNIHLLGTDINADVLGNAMRGHYSSWSFRATSDSMRERYFCSQNSGHTINDKLRHMPHFTFLNLADDAYPSILTQTNAMDLILCRNVFIYFDKAVVDRVMQRFSHCLLPAGVLMLGASDLIASSMESIRLVQHGDIFYYRNSGSVQPCEQTAHPPASSMQEKPEIPLKRHSIKAESKQRADLHEKLHDGHWHEALNLIKTMIKQQGKTAPLLQHQAKVMANMGDLKAAKTLCDESLQLDPLDKHSYFLMTMVLIELGDEEGAESNLRKTIYLDAQFIEAHFQLALLLIRSGQPENGRKSLNNALELARKAPPEDELHHAAGMNFKRFVEILEHEMEMYADGTQVSTDGY